uniref:Uncharacterized protein n=1 Tax=Mycobacterium leprae TaxID=1769 RepID=O05739_MYCLR|nr:unknown [Mycobacterium leprae]
MDGDVDAFRGMPIKHWQQSCSAPGISGAHHRAPRGIPGPSRTSVVIVRLRVDCLRVVHGIGDQRQQSTIHGVRAAIAHPGKQQQSVHRQAHPACFAFDPRHQHGHVTGRRPADTTQRSRRWSTECVVRG